MTTTNKRTPTTNPQIDGKPMSFVRLASTVAGVRYRQAKDGSALNQRFTDSHGRRYQAVNGTIYRDKAVGDGD